MGTYRRGMMALKQYRAMLPPAPLVAVQQVNNSQAGHVMIAAPAATRRKKTRLTNQEPIAVIDTAQSTSTKAIPEQVRANQANRKKWKGITPLGRLRLKLAALARQPRNHSTGPRNAEGMNKSKMNALKHGLRSKEAIAEQKEQAEFNRLIRCVLRVAPASNE